MPEDHRALRRLTRRITFASLGAGGVWIVTAWIVVPAVIQSAYGGGAFGAFSGLMAGRGVHPVEFYLRAWSTRSWQGLALLAGASLVAVTVLRPAAWRMTRAVYRRIPTFGGRVRRVTTLVTVVVFAMTVGQAIHLTERRESAQGYEYFLIAQSIAEGHGFKFPPGRQWLSLSDEPGADVYRQTAWKEPLYPYFMAAWLRLLGERRGRLTVLLFQAACVAATAFLVYRLGSLLYRPGVGAAAAVLTVSLPVLHYLAAARLDVSSVSGLLLVSAVFMLFRYQASPSNGRVVLLGLLLGFSALTHVLLILLVPMAAAFILLHTPGSTWRESARSSLLITLVAAVTIAPWTVRNHLEFGHIIVVQTGFGFFSNVANPYLAETYRPDLDACGDGSPPVDRVAGPSSAVRTFGQNHDFRVAAYRRAIACVAERAGPAYSDLNEHERDRLHRAEFVRFVAAEPRAFIELAMTKAATYIVSGMLGRISIVTAVLGVVGLLLTLHRPGMWIFPAIILVFTVVYSLTSPLFARYRAPLEPLFALMTVVALATILEPAWQRIRRAVEAIPERAT